MGGLFFVLKICFQSCGFMLYLKKFLYEGADNHANCYCAIIRGAYS